MASRGVNKVILVGNLGVDPEVRQSPNGSAVANLSVATGEAWKDQQGQLQERTEWHRVAIFGRTAEVARDYLRKGSKVYLEGRLQTRKWQDKNGQDRYTTEIVANEMQMLDGKPEAERDYGQPYPQQSAPRQAPRQAPPQTRPAETSGNAAPYDDEIPFMYITGPW